MLHESDTGADTGVDGVAHGPGEVEVHPGGDEEAGPDEGEAPGIGVVALHGDGETRRAARRPRRARACGTQRASSQPQWPQPYHQPQEPQQARIARPNWGQQITHSEITCPQFGGRCSESGFEDDGDDHRPAAGALVDEAAGGPPGVAGQVLEGEGVVVEGLLERRLHRRRALVEEILGLGGVDPPAR